MQSSGDALDACDQPAAVSAKVAEIFMSAGMAFQRLGDLTLQLHSQCDIATDENMKWTPSDMERLRCALKRFADDLCDINESVQAKTSKQIKQDIKRKSALGPESFNEAFSSAAAAATASSSVGHSGAPVGGHSTGRATPSTPAGINQLYTEGLGFPGGHKKRGRPRTRVMVEPVGSAVVNQLQANSPNPFPGPAHTLAQGRPSYGPQQGSSGGGRQQQHNHSHQAPPTVNMFGQAPQQSVDGFASGVGPGPALF